MKFKTFILLITPFFLFFQLQVTSQTLKPSIGLSSLPGLNDSICNIPLYLDPDGTFNSSGLQAGDTIHHFKLYDVNNQGTDMADELQQGKPILLVAGSYTCPVFRGKVKAIDNLATAYGSSISIFIIYVIEPHPDIDTSPYSGTVWTTSANVAAGILYRQPITYGDRLTIVNDMLDSMNITHRVLIDGPCNSWWLTFGPAPNNAYLIDPNGIVFAKHGWFNKLPHNMMSDMDSLLAITSVQEQMIESAAKVYPNPVHDYLTFEFNKAIRADLRLTNSMGKLVRSVQLNNTNEFNLQLNDLPRGIYFYEIHDAINKTIHGKVLIR